MLHKFLCTWMNQRGHHSFPQNSISVCFAIFPLYLKREDPIHYPVLNWERGFGIGFSFVLHLFVGILLENFFSVSGVVYFLCSIYVCTWLYLCICPDTYIHEENKELENSKYIVIVSNDLKLIEICGVSFALKS